MESDITVFVGQRLVKSHSPATCAGHAPVSTHPLFLLANCFFAAPFQSLKKMCLVVVDRKER